MYNEFIAENLKEMRFLTSRYVEHYQTDIAIDVETILTTDNLPETFIWGARNSGTHLFGCCDTTKMSPKEDIERMEQTIRCVGAIRLFAVSTTKNEVKEVIVEQAIEILKGV